jgi:hypothetical protein
MRIALQIAALAFLVTVNQAPAVAQIALGGTRPLNLDATIDNANDSSVRAATDGDGTWVAVWRASNHALDCPNGTGTAVSRSSDFGETWSPTEILDPRSDGTFGTGDVAADGLGNWVAIWITRDTLDGIGNDPDVGFVRSTDDGATWTELQVLNDNASADGFAEDRKPRVTTNGAGTWIATWYSKATLDGTIGNDQDILFARSEDGGATWSSPQPIVAEMATDTRHEQSAHVAADGEGTWVATWWSNAPGEWPDRILVSRSTDDGLNWSTPIEVSTTDGPHFNPHAATDGRGTWLVAWVAEGLAGVDSDVRFVRSADDGSTWSKPEFWNARARVDSDDDGTPSLMFDSRGTWVGFWVSTDSFDGTYGDDPDGFLVTSEDGGLTWSDPVPVNPWAEDDTSIDVGETIGTDGRGNWALIWTSNHTFDATVGEDQDIVLTRFRVPFAETCPGDADGDGYGSPGDPACPLGDATDCDDDDPRVSPGGRQLCDGVNNDCDDAGWPALAGTNETDDDDDGHAECAGLECDDADDGVWAPPGEVRELVLDRTDAGVTWLRWSLPSSPGGTADALRYDVLTPESTFVCSPLSDAQECLETGIGPEPEAFDSNDPAPGEVRFYQVRATNGCAGGRGPIGVARLHYYGTYYEAPRVARDCP